MTPKIKILCQNFSPYRALSFGVPQSPTQLFCGVNWFRVILCLVGNYYLCERNTKKSYKGIGVEHVWRSMNQKVTTAVTFPNQSSDAMDVGRGMWDKGRIEISMWTLFIKEKQTEKKEKRKTKTEKRKKSIKIFFVSSEFTQSTRCADASLFFRNY